MPTTVSESELLRRVARISDVITAEFAGTFGRETVERFVNESVGGLLARANVVDYVPLLAQRIARERLNALAQAEGLIAKDRPEVLFVCVHNAGRSQMAAALLTHLSNGRVHVRSAGSEPANQLNPAVVDAMAEIGLDISEEFPKPLNDEVVRAADVVITMGCGDACPIFPGKRYLDWELDDPAGQPIEVVRRIREAIQVQVEDLIAELIPAAN